MRRTIVSLLCLLLLSAIPVKALGASQTQNGVTVTLPDTAKAGETTILSVDSTHYVPGGGFWRVEVTWEQKPEGRAPEVLSGVPETDIRFFAPGKYRCVVETGIVTKGSCAGVIYDRLSKHTFDIEVKE